jgi:putative antirepressor|nr:MAG TPA: KilAC domain protein [Caudoviricetes sp.]
MQIMKIIDEREILGKQFRIFGDFENPLFLAKDVAEWIEYDTSSINKMLNNVDETEKVRKNVPTPGGNQEMWFLTEDGLYEVLMLSRKQIAKEFKKQIKEILKTIRKNGMYVTERLLDNPDLAIQAFTKLKEEREKRKELEAKIEEQKPQVLFANTVKSSYTSILVGELAKILTQGGFKTGQNRLFDLLRKDGFLISRQGTDYNMPTQKSMELGLFEIRESTVNNPDGSIRISKTPKVTGKGQEYFINRFLNKRI